MEEMHRTHKEPAWGWIGVVLEELKQRPRKTATRAKAGPRLVVTPWSPHSPAGWSA